MNDPCHISLWLGMIKRPLCSSFYHSWTLMQEQMTSTSLEESTICNYFFSKILWDDRFKVTLKNWILVLIYTFIFIHQELDFKHAKLPGLEPFINSWFFLREITEFLNIWPLTKNINQQSGWQRAQDVWHSTENVWSHQCHKSHPLISLLCKCLLSRPKWTWGYLNLSWVWGEEGGERRMHCL